MHVPSCASCSREWLASFFFHSAASEQPLSTQKSPSSSGRRFGVSARPKYAARSSSGSRLTLTLTIACNDQSCLWSGCSTASSCGCSSYAAFHSAVTSAHPVPCATRAPAIARARGSPQHARSTPSAWVGSALTSQPAARASMRRAVASSSTMPTSITLPPDVEATSARRVVTRSTMRVAAKACATSGSHTSSSTHRTHRCPTLLAIHAVSPAASSERSGGSRAPKRETSRLLWRSSAAWRRRAWSLLTPLRPIGSQRMPSR
mmetsp:Transcript_22143/g.52973  ORF Transcript_22143/g.52973 Transcript_22143/m.52973 type:complete len:262 (+) Transcript_22143:411-1196(+)